MKIAYKHLIKYIKSNPSIEEISEKLFQLGHEHNLEKQIFDMEITPNRGDCLSLKGILRELGVFYDINNDSEIYQNDIQPLNINFKNNAKDSCNHISFLKIEIEDSHIERYKGVLNDYFIDLDCNKNNFFTDISNYVSYETGQPTHCYDATKINNEILLDYIESKIPFQTLLNKKIILEDKNLVFLSDDKVINLAGIVGSEESSCSKNTTKVIVECAYFNPESIIGKSTKYDIQSDAAHKFERGVDPLCHDEVLRRFVKIVSDHASIRNIEVFSKSFDDYNQIYIPVRADLISKIIGFKIQSKDYIKSIEKLGFEVDNDIIKVPTFRSDISSQNDLAEEIVRIIGCDNIPPKEINLNSKSLISPSSKEDKMRNFLIDKGFYEVINYPFVGNDNKDSIKVDNPLDSNRQFLRTTLRQSLINNLLYNERRQKDAIKLFEVSDVYLDSDFIKKNRLVGIITSGRVGKNYLDFSKRIDKEYLFNMLKPFLKKMSDLEDISRESIESKIKSPITFIEFDVDQIASKILDYKELSAKPKNFVKYNLISEYPSSFRDLSFSIKDFNKAQKLDDLILNYKNVLIKDVYVFDYFYNEKKLEIKIGYRLRFQSVKKTITDTEVDYLISDIIEKALNIDSVTLPGYKKWVQSYQLQKIFQRSLE